MNTNIYENRASQCQTWMSQHQIDLLVLFPSPNLYYLTGFLEKPAERMLLLLLPASGAPCLIVPKLYEDHIRRDAWVDDLRVWKDGEDPEHLLRQAVSEKADGARHVLVDDQLWALFALPLQQICAGARLGLASDMLSQLRMRKDAAELSLLKQAGEIADQSFEWMCSQPFGGQSERQIAAQLEGHMRQLGGQAIAFPILVASGPNGAMPHHSAGDRMIEQGDVVIMDFGCQVNGYHSDITRTVVCGEPSDEVRQVYDVVQQAQSQGVNVCKPGVAAQSIDETTRGVIAEAGFGEYFIHRTGHGIGLEVHEPPYIVAGNDFALEAGMSFSVEPGVYLPEKFGVRVEDIVAIDVDGVIPMNCCTHELQVVK